MSMIFAVLQYHLCTSERKSHKKSESKTHLCYVVAELHQLSFQANWELVILSINETNRFSSLTTSLKAQLEEHCNDIAEFKVRVPFRAKFFRPFFRYCLSSIAKLRRTVTLQQKKQKKPSEAFCQLFVKTPRN